MKSMKLSAIVLGLAAASAFAQTAPAAAPVEQPADSAKTEAAQPAAEQATAEQAATPATDSAAVAAPKAEEPKTEVATETKTEEPKAEEPKAEEPKVEEKKEEVAKVEEPNVEESSFIDRLTISKADAEPEAKKAMEFKVSGQAEFDTYANWKNDSKKELYHSFASTVDVDFQVKFNDKWSAQVEIEADGLFTQPAVHYNEAFVQYQKSENFGVKFGDLTYSEGAFNYYAYDDPAINAAGMIEHNIRGIELDLYGLQLGLGFTRDGTDLACSSTAYDYNGNPIPVEKVCKSYDAHVAYQLDIAGQALRPFAHYQSWQTAKENELHAGLEAALEFGPFAIHAVYGLHSNNLTESSPKSTHTFLAEPSFKVANVSVKGGFFYALLDDNLSNATLHGTEIPEYMFAYGEGDIKLTDAITIGLLGELHTNSLEDDSDLGSLNFGTRIYFTPVDGLEVTTFAMGILPMGDDWEDVDHAAKVSTEDYGEDLNLKFGVEAEFSF